MIYRNYRDELLRPVEPIRLPIITMPQPDRVKSVLLLLLPLLFTVRIGY